MDADLPSWEIGLLGDAVADVVDACRHRGVQVLRKRGERVAVVVSAEDRDAIRSLLKDRLAEGSQERTERSRAVAGRADAAVVSDGPSKVIQETFNGMSRTAVALNVLRAFGGSPQLTCMKAARAIGIKRTKITRHLPTMGDLLVETGVGWKDQFRSTRRSSGRPNPAER